jgi:hypothetical protein
MLGIILIIAVFLFLLVGFEIIDYTGRKRKVENY